MNHSKEKEETAETGGAQKGLSDEIKNAHSAGNGALRLSEDGLIEPPGETIADADAAREGTTLEDSY